MGNLEIILEEYDALVTKMVRKKMKKRIEVLAIMILSTIAALFLGVLLDVWFFFTLATGIVFASIAYTFFSLVPQMEGLRIEYENDFPSYFIQKGHPLSGSEFLQATLLYQNIRKKKKRKVALLALASVLALFILVFGALFLAFCL